jgi:hypothetical protein
MADVDNSYDLLHPWLAAAEYKRGSILSSQQMRLGPGPELAKFYPKHIARVRTVAARPRQYEMSFDTDQSPKLVNELDTLPAINPRGR